MSPIRTHAPAHARARIDSLLYCFAAHREDGLLAIGAGSIGYGATSAVSCFWPAAHDPTRPTCGASPPSVCRVRYALLSTGTHCWSRCTISLPNSAVAVQRVNRSRSDCYHPLCAERPVGGRFLAGGLKMNTLSAHCPRRPEGEVAEAHNKFTKRSSGRRQHLARSLLLPRPSLPCGGTPGWADGGGASRSTHACRAPAGARAAASRPRLLPRSPRRVGAPPRRPRHPRRWSLSLRSPPRASARRREHLSATCTAAMRLQGREAGGRRGS